MHFKTSAGSRYVPQERQHRRTAQDEAGTAVYLELLFRKGVRDEYRREALAGLAKLENKSELSVLLDSIQQQDDQAGSRDESVVYDLDSTAHQPRPAELKESRDELVKMATKAKMPVTRQLGFIALIAADGGVDRAWSLALKSKAASARSRRCHAADPRSRPESRPLSQGGLAAPGAAERVGADQEWQTHPGALRPHPVAGPAADADAGRGGSLQRRPQYCPRRQGPQKNTAYGGDASRAIDGNKSGNYGGGGQTHTQENTANPWWQVDLGREYPIDAIVVWNRTDDDLGSV